MVRCVAWSTRAYPTDKNLQKCTIGFVFLDDSEATTFYNRVKHNNDTKSGELH